MIRGALLARESYDGFGRVRENYWLDLETSQTIRKTFEYDAKGRKTFESYPNAGIGTSYTYDRLGRTIRIQHPLGERRSFAYELGGLVVHETDERNNVTTYQYRAWTPDTLKALIHVIAPEGGIPSSGTMSSTNLSPSIRAWNPKD